VAQSHDLDEIDCRILDNLQENARISNVDLARRVGLSAAPCLRRLRALEESGVVRRYVALLDPHTVNLGLTVWIKVRLDLQVAKRFDLFEQNIMRRPEVLECYLLTGEADYLVRAVVADVGAYERFLKESLSRIEGVVSTNSSFGLKITKYSTALPLRPSRTGARSDSIKPAGANARRRPHARVAPQPPVAAPVDLDEIDRRILTQLQRNARISNVALAEHAGLSPAPSLRRVRALEKKGVIRKHVTLLDPSIVKLPVIVWTQVRLDLQVARRFSNFEHYTNLLPEVLECYLMAGEADYLIRVVVPDVAAYEQFLRNHLSRIESVVSTNSSFVLRVVKYSTELPLDQGRTGADETGQAARQEPGSRVGVSPSRARHKYPRPAQ
jgi:Lrp/AsnC family leucine-responsive transcriptional regulator